MSDLDGKYVVVQTDRSPNAIVCIYIDFTITWYWPFD